MTSVFNGLWQPLAALPPQVVFLYLTALLISAQGFYLTVYFISTGYSFSILGIALAGLFLFRNNLSWYSLLHSLLLALYGLRLGSYLFKREFKTAYKKELASVTARSNNQSWRKSALIWVAVSLLYVLMSLPNIFSLMTPPSALGTGAWLTQIAGLVIMAGGLGLETLADQQKSDFKARHPGQFCQTGLYRWVRCPNYLGEITFWVGNWVMGLAFYTSPLRWVLSLIGVICITLIMLGSTKRLEASQDERYGALNEYKNYIQTVPVLIPYVPVYSLKNIRVYLE